MRVRRRTLSGNRRRALVLLVALVLNALAATQIASAYWVSDGSSSDTSTLTSVNKANQPTATAGTGSVALSWAASTLASGAPVSGYEVRRYVGSTTTVVCTTATTSCADTAPVGQTVQYGVTARAGSWSGPESDRTSFTYDATAPVTTIDVNPLPNGAGWNRTNVIVTLNATDAGTGVQQVSYRINGGALNTVVGATTTFTVSGAGSHIVEYFARDHAGNVETTKTRTVKIDPNAPVSNANVSRGANAAGWTNDDVTVTVNAFDTGGSGVAHVTLDGVVTPGSVASKTYTTEGIRSVNYAARDVADNQEGNKSFTLRIDKTAPVISGQDPSAGKFANTWAGLDCATQPGRICANVTDAGGSGVGSVSVSLYRQSGWGSPDASCWNGTAWIVGSCPNLPMELVSGNQYRLAQAIPDSAFTLSQPYRMTFFAQDVAGNAVLSQVEFMYDASAPTTSIPQTSNWRNTAITQVWAFDPLSGIASISYRVDSNTGPFTTVLGDGSSFGEARFNLTNGVHTIDYFAVDRAGNVTVTVNDAIQRIDTNAPVVNGFDPAQGASGKWNQVDCSGGPNADRLCVNLSDALSGIDSTRVAWVLSRNVSGTPWCWNGTTFAAANCGTTLSTLQFSSGNTWRTPVLPAAQMVPGSYSFSVVAYDLAGNLGSNAVSFTVTP